MTYFFRLLSVTLFSLTSPTSALAASDHEANDYKLTSKLIHLPSPLSVKENGTLQFSTKDWKQVKDTDGTQILVSKSKKSPESKAAIIYGPSESLESLTAYSLSEKKSEQSVQSETASAVFFNKGKLTAYTQCEDSAEKESLGRICVTATPRLCQALKRGEIVPKEVFKEMDLFEMRSLAMLLTLRGPDHQLDNMVRSGNRLGLKSALQTTKGQLIILAKQIAKELTLKKPTSLGSVINTANASEAKPAQGNIEATATVAESVNANSDSESAPDSREPAASEKATEQRAQYDSKMARSVLERSIPRLRQACIETGFTHQ